MMEMSNGTRDDIFVETVPVKGFNPNKQYSMVYMAEDLGDVSRTDSAGCWFVQGWSVGPMFSAVTSRLAGDTGSLVFLVPCLW